MSIDIISDVMCDAGKSCGVESVCLYGGTSKGPQISSLKSGIVTVMKLKVDLECHKCYKKVKKVLAKEIRDEKFDEKQNVVTITVNIRKRELSAWKISRLSRSESSNRQQIVSVPRTYLGLEVLAMFTGEQISF
ncbi:hypothetical protein AHAS_Ahas08G0125200 [Arachis hypogaea]